MRYVSEVAYLTCISKWRPCTHEQFSQHLHNYNAMYCDEHGHDGVTITSYKLDVRGGIATIFFAKIKDPAIGTPVLMLLSGQNGKTLAFETTLELPTRG